MIANNSSIYDILFNSKRFRLRLVIEGILIGIITGALIVFFRFLLERAAILTNKIYYIERIHIWIIPIWIFVLIILSVIVGYIVKAEPMVSGSGIPQVEGLLERKLSMSWWKIILGKFVGGILAIGAGLSLGREGPSIQLGASIGQGLGQLFKRISIEEKYLITSGASGGLSAAFNAPLAGVIFSLEEVHKKFSPLVLISAMTSSITADFISREFFGLQPIFNFRHLPILPFEYYLYLLVLGIIVGVFGVFFNYFLVKTQEAYESQVWMPKQFRMIFPFLIAGILGLIMPQVLGGGHELVASLINGNFTIKALLLLVIVKFLFTMLSYGSGVPGGIFLPLLVIGALTGEIYGSVVVSLFHINSDYIDTFMILAMTGYFTAIVRAPITGSILITEMTGSFGHLLSLTTIAIISYIVADVMNSDPIYETLLQRILDGRKGSENIEKGET